MKESVYVKAKVSLLWHRNLTVLLQDSLLIGAIQCLYENGGETDKVVLIQSASLLAFWYNDTEDRTQSWHWSGIAIGLCQTLGFHRDLRPGTRNDRGIDCRKRLWRCIWWGCVFRDRWLSFGMGRPMRINIDDCDTPMPTAGDVEGNLNELSSIVRERYIPSDSLQLAHHWIVLLRLSKALGIILSVNYRPNGLQPTATEIERLEVDLSACSDYVDNASSNSRLATFHIYNLQLHYK
jgi:Fungal specific transcription factor domain